MKRSSSFKALLANQARHRIAATLGCCIIWTDTSGRLAVRF